MGLGAGLVCAIAIGIPESTINNKATSERAEIRVGFMVVKTKELCKSFAKDCELRKSV